MARKSRAKPASRSTLRGSAARAVAADCRVRQVDLDLRIGFAVPSPAPITGTSSSRSTDSAGGSLSGHVESGVAAALWRVRRPGWTQAGWWDTELRPEVRALLWLPVGRELQDHLIAVARADSTAGYTRGHCPFDHTTSSLEDRVGVPGSPCACQVITVAAWAAVASWVTSWADRAVVDTAGPTPVEEFIVATRPDLGTITDPAVEDLATALRVSPGSARHRLTTLRRVHALPRLRFAVAQGLMIGWHAQVLTSDLRHLPAEAREQVIDAVLDRVRERRRRGLRDWTATDLRAQAKTIAASLDLDLAVRRKDAHRGRGVRLRLHGHGAATISAELADDVATRIYRRLTAIAAGVPAPSDDPDDTFPDQHGRRSLDQRRADVFTDLLLGPPPLPNPGPGSDPGAGSEVAVVIDAATLLGLAENPGQVPGCGPIPAEVARALAADRKWRAWITHTSDAGARVVATSPGTYRPTAAVARLVRARDPHCRMPGCRSTVTDLDHIVAFPRGQTTPDNLQPLCRRHHRLKTHTRWRVTHDTDTGDGDSTTWTSPTGITHTDTSDPP